MMGFGPGTPKLPTLAASLELVKQVVPVVFFHSDQSWLVVVISVVIVITSEIVINSD